MRLDNGEKTACHVTKKPKTSEDFHMGENVYKVSTLEAPYITKILILRKKKNTKIFKMITVSVSLQKN